jgi:thiol-disulfide isomerase/thioredoxin
MPSALLLPLLTCSVVLLLSGAAKLRDHGAVDAAFTSMRVPAPLDASWVRRVLPWAELALGLWLLVATGPALVVVGFLVLVLFLAYLGLVVRALADPAPADCGCFGAIGESRVTAVTAWRNGLLVLAAALTLVAGFRDVSVLGDLRVDGVWAWLVAAVLAVSVAVLVTWRPPAASDTAPATMAATTDEDGEYVRRPIPRTQVQARDGSLVLLTTEAANAAHLLVFLSPGCGPCQSIAPDLASWREQLAPAVRVRSVLSATPAIAELKPDFADGWFDPHGVARAAFGVGNPSAVLLGADGELAGGPVSGEPDVRAFVEEIAEHLREAREEQATAEPELEAVSDDR